jgi:hypothetical protein
MKPLKTIAIMFNLLVMSLISSVVGAPTLVAVALGLVIGLVPGLPKGAFGMALQKEIWETDIVGGLFADNSFLSKAYNADQYVLAGKVVHIPQAGSPSSVTKNRTSLPATVTKRTDSELTYSLAEFTTDPRLIPDADKVELSYDKRQSVISEDKAALVQAIAKEFVYMWSPTLATSILRTTGGSVDAHLADATGLRKAITLANVNAAASLMNARDIPQEGRYALIDSIMYDQLIAEMSGNQQRDFLAGLDPLRGVIGKYGGFDFYMRSSAARYDNASTPVPVAPETAAAATDNAAGLFWQINSVERAMGEVKAFDNPGDATYYGDILSFLCRAGGRKRRADQFGIVAVVQAAAEPVSE